MRSLRLLAALLCVASSPLFAAQLGATSQSVLPATSRQIISIDYHRLSSDATAKQVEDQVLPPEMRSLTAMLGRGGVDAQHDIDRLTFATYGGDKGLGMIGIAEGNFQKFKLDRFFHKTPKHPHPPQYNGVDVYSSDGLNFFLPDRTTMVFGNQAAIHRAVDVEQGSVPRLEANGEMTDLIAGTQSSDVWSVLDAAGARNMIGAMAANTGKFDTASLADRFNGARYTIQFQNNVNVNLELMTRDAMSAAALSTGLRAAVLYRQYQERDPAMKTLLSSIQVDSAGDHTFLQVSSNENTVRQLLHSDLFNSIVR